MEVGKTFKKLMIDKDVKQTDVADTMGISKQYFNDQLRRNNFRISEVIKVADILGYSVRLQFIDKESGKTIEAE